MLAVTTVLLATGCFSPDPTVIEVVGSTGPGPQVPAGSTGVTPVDSTGGAEEGSGQPGDPTAEPPDPSETSGPQGAETTGGDAETTSGDAESTGSSSTGSASSGSSSSTGEPIVEHFIFITADTYSANLGGLDGADALCSELGAQTEVEGPWRAVLRDVDQPLESRITIAGEVFRLDGELVNADAESFFAGVAENPVDVTETGESPTDTVAWVGAADADCDGWTSSSSAVFGRQALSTNLAQWLTGSSNGPCWLSRSLYCISQPES